MSLSYFDNQLFERVLEKNFPKEKAVFSKNDIIFLLSEMSNVDKYYIKEVFSEKPAKHKVFKYFVRYCLYRNLANYDTMILLTGNKGVGKSSFAMMLAREWCKLLGLVFRPSKYIAYTNTQVQDKVDTLPKFSPLICDETINFATTEAWAKSENKELKKKLGQVRTKHFFYILCFPLKIQKVDKVYLESYVNYWIECVDRGLGVLFVPDKNPVMDAWRLKDFMNIGNYTEFTNVVKVKKALSRHPNFWYVISCAKPPEQLYSEYLIHREQNVYSEAGVLSSVTKQDIYRAVLIKVLQDIMVRDSSLSMKRLLLHIKNEYNIDLRESDLTSIIKDAEMLLAQIKDEGKAPVQFIDEVAVNRKKNDITIE